jgi:hypothetical protein
MAVTRKLDCHPIIEGILINRIGFMRQKHSRYTFFMVTHGRGQVWTSDPAVVYAGQVERRTPVRQEEPLVVKKGQALPLQTITDNMRSFPVIVIA